MSDFNIGDHVFYVLPKGNGRETERRFAATVINIKEKRIVIRLDGSPNHRNVLPTSLVREVEAR